MTPARRLRNLDNGWRLNLIRGAIALFFLLLLGRLFSIQILQYKYYSALAAVRSGVSSVLAPERGQILVQDKDGFYPVVTNKEAENLIISPKDIGDDETVATLLSEIVGIDKEEIIAQLRQKDKRYRLLKKDLTDSEIARVGLAKNEGKLPKLGVWLESETKRYYPEGDFLSHTLGFVSLADEERAGVYGLEKSFNDILAGVSGKLEAAADAAGSLVAGSFRKLIPAKNGSTLLLTISRPIQVEAETILKTYVERFQADGGSIIVVNPKNGEILALASAPSFNPNEYNKVKDILVFSNPAIQARYEPGSVVKPLTMAIGLETGKVTPDETYQDRGAVVLGENIIQNSDGKSYGVQNMVQVLEKSLNTGIVYVQRKIGKEVFANFMEDFGLSSKTGITLPGEIAGDLRNLSTNSEIAYATAAFGQGISVTPLELIQAYTAIANGGEIQKLHIISEIQNPDGSRDVVNSESLGRVLSEKSAAQAGSMMVSVVENGHGKRAQVPGFYIAGKTGTAQVPLETRRGYDPDKTIGSFIGFGPADDPAFLALVKIDNPKGIKFAESTAAPAFGELAKFILNYLQIPPTRSAE